MNKILLALTILSGRRGRISRRPPIYQPTDARTECQSRSVAGPRPNSSPRTKRTG